ncbi:MAG: hypothetical protein SF123_12510 [Chloroflexota bacterium]|nr:hypothetical protein [Chloroflexota bacterium]
MLKPKRDTTYTAMVERLRRNRDGRLTAEQWLSITVEPLITVLILLTPILIVMILRLGAFTRLLPIFLVLLAFGTLAMLLFRARRYARLPMQTGVLYAAEQPMLRRLLTKTAVFYDDAGNVYRFSHWLAPRIPILPNQAYRIYYLKDSDRTVLCSVIPEDNPEAAQFAPSHSFQHRVRRPTAQAT